MKLYIIGSLRNPRIPEIANALEAAGHDAFADWFAAGATADDAWKAYEQRRGRTYQQALKGRAARHVFAFDKQHLEDADAVVLVTPAGRSGFLELGWALGSGKFGWILLEKELDRWDVMFQFATGVATSMTELLGMISEEDFIRLDAVA